MNSVLVNLASKFKFHRSTRRVSNYTQVGICQEETFRYLLKAEHKRAQRSGHAYYILLVYRTDDTGLILHMDSNIANEIFDALARSLRETDYVGWYREGYIAGGLLTVVGPDSVGNVHERVRRQLRHITGNSADHEKSGSFQTRLYHQHELQEMQLFGKEVVVVQ